MKNLLGYGFAILKSPLVYLQNGPTGTVNSVQVLDRTVPQNPGTIKVDSKYFEIKSTFGQPKVEGMATIAKAGESIQNNIPVKFKQKVVVERYDVGPAQPLELKVVNTKPVIGNIKSVHVARKPAVSIAPAAKMHTPVAIIENYQPKVSLMNQAISYLPSYEAIVAYGPQALKVAGFLSSIKFSISVAMSTASLYFYAPTAFTVLGTGLLLFAAYEYCQEKKGNANMEYTRFALGVISTFSGIGLGVPILHKLGVTSITAGLFIAGNGTSLISKPLVSTVLNGLMGTAGYLITNAVAYATYVALDTKVAKDIVKAGGEVVKENANYAVDEAVKVEKQKWNNATFCYIPYGKVVSYGYSLLGYAANGLINKSVDNLVVPQISAIGENGQNRIFNQFVNLGDNFVSKFTVIPSKFEAAFAAK